MNREAVLAGVRASIALQAEELKILEAGVGPVYADVIELILATRGRVVISGMGKSGHIARKAAATLSSTGTPAIFLHPSESLHGDLGMVTKDDLVLFISKSGENPELNLMLPTLRRIGVPIVAITGTPDSSLAKMAVKVLPLGAVREICPLRLAPTTSATLTLVILDAIAIELMRLRNFKAEDYALFHPGGQLGKRLLYLVRDLMVPATSAPKVSPLSTPKEMLHEITCGRMGAVVVLDDDQKMLGLITDNDVRRTLENHEDFFSRPITGIMNPTPLTCSGDDNAFEVLIRMRKRPVPITLMPVADAAGRFEGIIRLETMVQTGLV